MALTTVRPEGMGFVTGRRNLVINGAMQVAQRGTSATVGPNGTGEGYTTVDRWENPLNGSVVSTFSQSTEAPSGFAHSAKIEITTADTSLSAAEFWFFRTKLEGQDVQLLGKGTSGAKPLTLSFWVKSNKTGTYTAEVKDSDNDRSASLAYTINSSNTWEHKTLTYSADTTGAFDNDNAASLNIQFWLVSGSQYQGGTFSNGTFEAEVNANRVHSSQVNLGDTVGNEWYITGVQLEVGENASDFEYRSFGEELALCQRYYYRHADGADFATAAVGLSGHYNSSILNIVVEFPVTMRTNPSLSCSNSSGAFRNYRNNSNDTFDTFTHLYSQQPNAAAIETNSGVSGTAGHVGRVEVVGSSIFVAFDAEL